MVPGNRDHIIGPAIQDIFVSTILVNRPIVLLTVISTIYLHTQCTMYIQVQMNFCVRSG